jgi:hypothetical protein
MAVVALLLSAQGASASAVNFEVVTVIPFAGETASDPCTGDLLGFFTGGTFTLTQRYTVTPTGNEVYRTHGLWQDVEFTGLDGTGYRLIARSSDIAVVVNEQTVGATVGSWTMLGPSGGPFFRGQSVRVVIDRAGALRVLVERVSDDASCGV